MEITKTKNGKRYMIQVDDILFFYISSSIWNINICWNFKNIRINIKWK